MAPEDQERRRGRRYDGIVLDPPTWGHGDRAGQIEADLAPLLVIVEEAGGRFTNLEGERTAAGGSAVATNGLLHDEVLAALAPAIAQ